MNANHTPTPWQVRGNDESFIVGGNPTTIVACLDHNEARGTNRYNAEHIARCVNAHDELVAALRKIDQAWPAHGSATDNAIADAMAQVARAALAKVEG